MAKHQTDRLESKALSISYPTEEIDLSSEKQAARDMQLVQRSLQGENKASEELYNIYRIPL
jgi:hypothetical protein